MRITIRDIAKELQLSHATISFVLNNRRDVSIPDSTRQRVKEAAERMGYKPNRAARALAKGESDLIALWVPSRTVNDFWKLAEQLEMIARSKSMEVVLRTASFDDQFINSVDLEDWPIAATLLLDCGEAPWISSATKLDHPVASIGTIVSNHVDSVAFDVEQGARLAAEEFAEQNVSKALHISLADVTDPFDSRRALIKGAMSESGVVIDSLVCVDGSHAGIKASLKVKIEKSGVPQAIIADTDSAAIACIRALHDLGQSVPQDCLIIGFGGTADGEVSLPSLTTVAYPAAEAVEKAWILIDQRRSDPKRPPVHVKVSPRLIIRESSRRAV